MSDAQATKRTVLEITGSDRLNFLQGLVTNDIGRLKNGLVYAALLSPQGKYLADFFLAEHGDSVHLDVRESFAKSLIQRLNMYKLRADIEIAETGLNVQRGLGDAPDGGLTDPRSPALGWRKYSPDDQREVATDWDAIRVAQCIPETGIELIANETYILEVGFERLSGVDFKKGCYVGQEVTARMKHKTELKKGLATVEISSPVPVGSEILADGRPAGVIHTQSQGRAIAYLRFDRAQGAMTVTGHEGVTLKLISDNQPS